ncbi:hypothetical protein EV183_003233 [Coemansia sp. RSA 2336]|nr:hypothetical protein EV183_003233 [Coemansia sp. RSA 2336]
MLKVKKLLSWCIRHTTTQRRTRVFGRRASTSSTASTRQSSQYQESIRNSLSSETLVDEKHRVRMFGEPAITEIQHVYSYYPWTESEHEEILRRSPPPPSRRHYETFPSLVEMGGLLAL